MKYILSRYNHDISWLTEYTDDYVLYDRSEEPLEGSIVMPNIGSDWYDKFTYIINNYEIYLTSLYILKLIYSNTLPRKNGMRLKITNFLLLFSRNTMR